MAKGSPFPCQVGKIHKCALRHDEKHTNAKSSRNRAVKALPRETPLPMLRIRINMKKNLVEEKQRAVPWHCAGSITDADPRTVHTAYSVLMLLPIKNAASHLRRGEIRRFVSAKVTLTAPRDSRYIPYSDYASTLPPPSRRFGDSGFPGLAPLHSTLVVFGIFTRFPM